MPEKEAWKIHLKKKNVGSQMLQPQREKRRQLFDAGRGGGFSTVDQNLQVMCRLDASFVKIFGSGGSDQEN